ncbi:MAG: PqqD family protein [Chloroflexi bacterium]|nr:PqqD family protein [Chloroflexota bacterium]
MREDYSRRGTVRRSAVALDRDVADQLVILNTQTEQYYTVNRVGAEIWHLLDGSRDFEAILAVLCTRYDVPEEELRADLGELLDGLTAHGLVEWM